VWTRSQKFNTKKFQEFTAGLLTSITKATSDLTWFEQVTFAKAEKTMLAATDKIKKTIQTNRWKNGLTLLAVRFHIVTSWPDLSKLSTAPEPMRPRPRKPIFIGVAMIFFDTKVSQRDGSTSGKNGCSLSSGRLYTHSTSRHHAILV